MLDFLNEFNLFASEKDALFNELGVRKPQDFVLLTEGDLLKVKIRLVIVRKILAKYGNHQEDIFTKMVASEFDGAFIPLLIAEGAPLLDTANWLNTSAQIHRLDRKKLLIIRIFAGQKPFTKEVILRLSKDRDRISADIVKIISGTDSEMLNTVGFLELISFTAENVSGDLESMFDYGRSVRLLWGLGKAIESIK